MTVADTVVESDTEQWLGVIGISAKVGSEVKLTLSFSPLGIR